jgi:hypothetical protein
LVLAHIAGETPRVNIRKENGASSLTKEIDGGSALDSKCAVIVI